MALSSTRIRRTNSAFKISRSASASSSRSSASRPAPDGTPSRSWSLSGRRPCSRTNSAGACRRRSKASNRACNARCRPDACASRAAAASRNSRKRLAFFCSSRCKPCKRSSACASTSVQSESLPRASADLPGCTSESLHCALKLCGCNSSKTLSTFLSSAMRCRRSSCNCFKADCEGASRSPSEPSDLKAFRQTDDKAATWD
mmetsp:Transcript_168410/g.541094  ORF Transcript_168410/g.541094 Transcript_168410/m.541094 type:complete len:202 (-) Transcript_168410:584-1189(-)